MREIGSFIATNRQMEESLLIKKAIDGDLDAFIQLVISYQELAFTLAYRIMNNEAAADDATQDAVNLMYRNMDSYRGDSFK